MAIEPCRTLGNHIVPHNRVGYRAFRNGWFPSACQLFGWRLNCLDAAVPAGAQAQRRSEEHTSELQSLMRISYAVFCLKKKKTKQQDTSKYFKLHTIEQQQQT